MSLVLRFDDDAISLIEAGGKGESLARMARAGLPVPAGFIVTTEAFSAQLAEGDLGTLVAGVVAGLGEDPTPQQDEAASRQIRTAFAAASFPETVATAVRQAYAALGSPVVAVRSSATAEDLPEASFAGQQDTVLGVREDGLPTPSGSAGRASTPRVR